MNPDPCRICPASLAAFLDNRVRKIFHDPHKILAPFVSEGMTVMDLGCGPGFFSIAMAELVGASGRVIAADLQQDMLAKVAKKISGTAIERRIALHRCGTDGIGFSGDLDFILAFYLLHEVPDQARLFQEAASLLKQGGAMLIVEPKPFHVSKKKFEETIRHAEEAGLRASPGPSVFIGRSVLLEPMAEIITDQKVDVDTSPISLWELLK